MNRWKRVVGVVCAVALAACADEGPVGLDRTAAPAPGARAAVAFDGDIRIGIVPSATTMRFGAAGGWTVTEKATGAVMASGVGGEAEIVLAGTSVVKERYRLQTECTTSASRRDSWVAAASAKGYFTYTEYVPSASCWRLFIGDFPKTAGWGERNTFRNKVIADGLDDLSDSFWKLLTIVEGITQIRVDHGGSSAVSNGAVVLTSDDDVVTINGAPYRGVAEATLNSAGTLAGVNEVDLEQYLYGVVPRELPPTVWHQLEAQKAQAVAARTYAMSGLGKRAKDGYDLLPTTSDQVYGGYAAEHPLSTQAVDETRSIVAKYDGKLIQALFSSTSGGHTADNEEVYNSAPVPYLRGVPDKEQGNSLEKQVEKEKEFKYAKNPQSLKGFKGGDYEADWSRYHRWHYQWTQAEIREVAADWAGRDIGDVLAINALERGPSGRILVLQLVAEQDTLYAYKDAIRWSLKFFGADGSKRSMLSTLFYIEPVLDKQTKQVAGFEVWGGGWGHGVGLSQTGAAGMADKKHSYEEILKHYYRDITLEPGY